MFYRPWHFQLEDISAPVVLWHGTADRNVPVGLARLVERRVPHCTANIIEGAGHFVFLKVREEIVRSVLPVSGT
jgi:pimeloyl-ACP methyl ester carboxylesterase